MGIGGVSGGREKGRTKDNFRLDRRNDVKAALVDLELFIERADKQDVNQVITWESLMPVVKTLFHDQAEPDPVKAQIAQLFIEEGFAYLVVTNREPMTKAHMRTGDEATDIVNFLVESLKPEGKRFFRSSYPGAY